MSDYEEDDEKWVQWFCSLAGNEYFCEVPHSYIEDSFNLYGLRSLVPNYQEAINIILDMTDIPYDEDVPTYAAELYGLIHARYIITSHGLDNMMRKYREGDFGMCPRALCEGQLVVPAGLHDDWKKSEMKVFCPKCRDLYTPSREYQSPAIDGAYFGTTFPHLFFMTYRDLEPQASTTLYVPRIFGYKIHRKGENRRRLTLTARAEEEEEEEKSNTQKRGTSAANARKKVEEEARAGKKRKPSISNEPNARRRKILAMVDTISHKVSTALQLSDDWDDVTDVLTKASKELKVGQLVHVPGFNLFDSMTAMELMDRKMDAGMLENGRPPLSASERLQQGLVPLQFENPKDLLATVDQLLRCQTAWMDGQPLAQTLLTSVYLHPTCLTALFNKLPGASDNLFIGKENEFLDTVEQKLGSDVDDTLTTVFAATVLSVLKISNLIRHCVLRADIYEEEDFSPGNGLNLGALEKVSYDTTLKLLQVAKKRLSSIQAQFPVGKKGKKKPKASTDAKLSALHSQPKRNAVFVEAFSRRLTLLYSLLEAFASLGTVETNVDFASSNQLFSQTQQVLDRTLVESVEEEKEIGNGKAIGFDTGLSRLLLSGAPPRQVSMPTNATMWTMLKTVVKEMETACATRQWRNMEELRIFLSDFSRRKPGIISRSYVLLFLYVDKKIYGKFNFMEWLSEDMVLNGVPAVLLSTQEGMALTTRAIELVYESMRVPLHNRSRQRDRMEYLLQEWGALQLDAAAVDASFTQEMDIPKENHPRYFTAWTLEQCLQLMIPYVALGIELDLYAPTELTSVFWYLDFLYGSRVQSLQFTWNFLDKMKEMMPEKEQATEVKQTSAKGSKKGKGKKKSKGDKKKDAHNGKAEALDENATRFTREIEYCEMQRGVMRALFQLFSVLEREGAIQRKQAPYSSSAIRFAHRFGAFRPVHFPSPLAYEDFVQNSDFSSYEPQLVRKSAEECFKVAKKHGEQLVGPSRVFSGSDDETGCVHGSEAESVVRVCVANAQELTKTAGPDVVLDLDFSLHPQLPVAAVVSKKE